MCFRHGKVGDGTPLGVETGEDGLSGGLRTAWCASAGDGTIDDYMHGLACDRACEFGESWCEEAERVEDEDDGVG